MSETTLIEAARPLFNEIKRLRAEVENLDKLRRELARLLTERDRQIQRIGVKLLRYEDAEKLARKK